MRSKVESMLLKLLSKRMAMQANRVELMPKYNLGKNVKLDLSEIKEIEKIWSDFSNKTNFRYWEMYKGMFEFNPYLIPDDIYVSRILRVLNPIRKCYCLQNKNMYPLIYEKLRKPKTFINCIDGHILDRDNKFINTEYIYPYLKKYSKEDKLILKPSADSCSGMGVILLDLNNEEASRRSINSAGLNYVIQELILQSEITKQFNPSSLNTFRVNTLNLNGNITVENIMFRHGRGDSIVDNAGSGGICVGFNPYGRVVGKAIDAGLNEYETTPFGVKYRDLFIKELSSISELAIEAHRQYLQMLGHAAWDFALDSDNEPVFIEVNLGWPGIMTEQLSSCRPIFGDRTVEALEYAKEHRKSMSFTEFIGHWT